MILLKHDHWVTLNIAENEMKITNLVGCKCERNRKNRISDLYFLQDNAPVHICRSTSTLLDSGMVLLPHPPYSPDLVPSNFYLFQHTKKALRGKKFNNKDLKEAVLTF